MWFVRHWRVEVTFHEVRTHLGVETQRQWSDLAIARTAPILLGLFSLVPLWAHQTTQTAWYAKECPTFSDALAEVRRQVWQAHHLSISISEPDMQKLSLADLQPWLEALCYSP
jgi:hypothetical protein